MYTEEDYEEREYEERGFSLKKILFRFLIIVIIIILVIYLMVKVIMPKLDNKKTSNNKNSSNEIMETNSKTIKTSIFNYYNDKDVPEEEKMTINELIDNGIISSLKEDKDNKLDYDDSYIQITKMGEDYALKINLKTATDEKYYMIYFGQYEYCEEQKLCEKDDTKKSSSEPTADEKKDDDTNYDEKTPIKQSTEDTNNQEETKEEVKEEIKEEKVKTLYKYEKITPTKLSDWSEWTSWAKTTCTLNDISCSNDDENCLLELKIKRESNGTICYKSLRKRTKISSSYKTTRWSKYDDKDLLDNGWKYTGETKESK